MIFAKPRAQHTDKRRVKHTVIIMHEYILYILLASLTIASPGPGVVLTLTNSLRFGLLNTIPGIIGISLGMLFISIVVASGIGIIIARSITIFSLVKYIGATYLVYLGLKLWRATNLNLSNINSFEKKHVFSRKKYFKEGLGITILNPKPIIFFIAFFPQFIDSNQSYLLQFSLLSTTFCFLIVIIHLLYAIFAQILKYKASGSDQYFLIINKVGCVCFIGFALGLIFFDK
jgi:homoserine/homoserine lactone efflux protein